MSSASSAVLPQEITGMMFAEIGQAVARQRDRAVFNNGILDGVLASVLLASNDAAENVAVRIPTTLGLGTPNVNPPAAA